MPPSTYFQGGDFVELLSAQGKAPASTWKLQGKIVKSFDKTIKGNVFLMEGGSSETRVQLPKSSTSSTLGLTHRFLVLQVFIPFTRSFSVEVSFSDFQKIRRRLVCASAFREMTTTALHAQIPLASGVTRDQWMNLVFDLQALAEQCFAGTSFRTMDSLSIGGSCRLKRIFTMKDAPNSSNLDVDISSNVHGLSPTHVAQYAPRKDIPKSFVFSCGGNSLPVPTEYFLAPYAHSNQTESNANATGGTISSNDHGKQNIVSRGRSAPSKPRRGDRYPERGGKALLNPRTQTSTSPHRLIDSEASKANVNYLQATTTMPPEERHEHEVVCKDDSPQKTTLTPKNAAVAWTPDIHNGNHDELSPVPSRLEGEMQFCDTINQTHLVDRDDVTNTLPSSELRMHLTASPPAVGKTRLSDDQKKQRRREVLASIQSKLEAISDDDHDINARSRELFLRHSSLHLNDLASPGGQTNRHTDGNCLAYNVTHPVLHSNADPELPDRTHVWHDHEMLRSPEPLRLERCEPTKKPPITFSSSIFLFNRKLESTNATATHKGLFDWDSLLDATAQVVDEPPIRQFDIASPTNEDPEDETDESCDPPSTVDHPSTEEVAYDDPITQNGLRRGIITTSDENTVPLSGQGQIADQDKPLETSVSPILRCSTAWKGADCTMLETSFDFALSPTDQSKNARSESELPKVAASSKNSMLDNDSSLSLDLTEELNKLSQDVPSTSAASFNFDDLVAENFERKSTADVMGKGRPMPQVLSPSWSPTVAHRRGTHQPPRDDVSNTLRGVASRQSRPSPAIPTGQRNSVSKSERVVADLNTTSHQRLASLLESTDWSQFPLSSIVRSKTGVPQRTTNTTQSHKHEQSPTASIELVYDPILRCYYDPIGHKYYTINQ